MIGLANFTSFIEIGATITGAFVIVEYAKQYTCLLAQKVFDFEGEIGNNISDCKKLIDEETIDGLSSFTIEGCNTGIKIEGLKREKEKLLSELKDKERDLKNYVLAKCNSKSHSALSLFLFLFLLAASFFAGIEDTLFFKFYWIIIVILSFLFVTSSWILGERKNLKIINYSSLSHAVYILILIFIAGRLLIFLMPEELEAKVISYYPIAVYITLFLPFLNFLIFAFRIKGKSKEINKEIKCVFEPLIKKSKEIQEKTKPLAAAKKLALEMKKEQKQTKTVIPTVNRPTRRKKISLK